MSLFAPSRSLPPQRLRSRVPSRICLIAAHLSGVLGGFACTRPLDDSTNAIAPGNTDAQPTSSSLNETAGSPSGTSPSDSTGPSSTETESPFCEDGARKPCAETNSGQPILFPTGEPIGSCQRGVSICKGNAWSSCVGAIPPKPHDTCEPGNDDNCNGKPTDHCRCVAGQRAPCGESTGACHPGTMICTPEGRWGECLGATGPRPELCDGQNIDEDCNGQADLEDPACECINDAIEGCPLLGQGDCAQGVKQCFKGRKSPCKPRFPKLSVEQCGTRKDGHESSLGPATGDENCNGLVDETDWASPSPTGCALYMMDKDKDGWGAAGQDFASTADASQSTWGCFCPSKIPAGWTKGTSDTVAKDCGDCLDGGFEVKPERSVPPQETPSICLTALGSATPFDYNCSGKHERAPDQRGVFKCEYVEGQGCVATGYWMESTPDACGEAAPYMTQEKHCILGSKGDELRTQCLSYDILLTATARCH